MKSIGFAFNDFNFIVYSFQLTSVDGVITVVDDPVTVPLQHSNKCVYRSIFQGTGQVAPLIECLGSPGPGAVSPYVFEFFL